MHANPNQNIKQRNLHIPIVFSTYFFSTQRFAQVNEIKESDLTLDKRGKKQLMVGPYIFEDFDTEAKAINELKEEIKKTHKVALAEQINQQELIRQRGGAKYLDQLRGDIAELEKKLQEVTKSISFHNNRQLVTELVKAKASIAQRLENKKEEAKEIGLIKSTKHSDYIDLLKFELEKIQSGRSYVALDKQSMIDKIFKDACRTIESQPAQTLIKIKFLTKGHGVTNTDKIAASEDMANSVSLKEVAEIENAVSKKLHERYGDKIYTSARFVVCDLATNTHHSPGRPRIQEHSVRKIHINDLDKSYFKHTTLGTLSQNYLTDLNKVSGYEGECAKDILDNHDLNNRNIVGSKISVHQR